MLLYVALLACVSVRQAINTHKMIKVSLDKDVIEGHRIDATTDSSAVDLPITTQGAGKDHNDTKATTQEPPPCITVVKPADDDVDSKKTRKGRGKGPRLNRKHSHALNSGNGKGIMPEGTAPRFSGDDDDNVDSSHKSRGNVTDEDATTLSGTSEHVLDDLFNLLKHTTLEPNVNSTTTLSATGDDNGKSATPCTVIVTATTPTTEETTEDVAAAETPAMPSIINAQNGHMDPQLRKLEILDDIVNKGDAVKRLDNILDKTLGGDNRNPTMPPPPELETEPLEASGLKYNLADDDDD